MKVVIAAAGTGGHINPGIAIANKIKSEQPDSEIIFIGTDRGLENDLVPKAGYGIKHIGAYGVYRKPTIENLKRLIKTIHSISEAKKILKEFKPDLVIGTGGYITLSVCRAAQKLQIPYIIHESNVLPGIATKLMSKKAKYVMLGFKEAKYKLNPKVNTVVTGTPSNTKCLNLTTEQKDEKIKELGLNSKLPIILVFGGSQGAKSINTAVEDLVIKENNYQIIWAPGKKNFEEIKEYLSEKGKDIENIKNARILPYIYNMEEIMNISDLVVSRSGAMTIIEIENVGKPAILVPFPFAAENHQEYNARAIEKANAAKVILDKDLNTDILDKTIIELIEDKNKLKQMSENSRKLAIENVEEKNKLAINYHEIREEAKWQIN